MEAVQDRLGAHRDRVGQLTPEVIKLRESFDFMMVARALVLAAEFEKPESGKAVAEALGISKQTRHNWFYRDLSKWLDEVEDLIGARSMRHPPPSGKPRKSYITEGDWAWIRERLSRTPIKSWEYRAKTIRDAAANSKGLYRHLVNINRATLWRNRGRFLSAGSKTRPVEPVQADEENAPDKNTDTTGENPF